MNHIWHKLNGSNIGGKTHLSLYNFVSLIIRQKEMLTSKLGQVEKECKDNLDSDYEMRRKVIEAGKKGPGGMRRWGSARQLKAGLEIMTNNVKWEE